MLLEIIEKAVLVGGSFVEFERKYGKEEVTAFNVPIGLGIGCLEGEDAKSLFKEMDELKKTKRVVINGSTYRLAFSRYESFGEWGPSDPNDTVA